MVQKHIIFRLASIKYLYKIALEQSYKPLPFASFSILSLHDAVEMFLILLAEVKNKRSDNVNFMQYWELIPSLTYQEQMRKFNRLRRELKHQGIIPSEIEIETSKNNISNFFVENCRKFFDISFDDVSLIDLIKYDETRNLLLEASQFFQKDELDEAVRKAALAFHKCFREYYLHKCESKEITQKKPSLSSHKFRNIDREIVNIFRDLKGTIESIQYQLKLLSLGIDLNKYEKFLSVTPTIVFTLDGSHQFIYEKRIDIKKDDVTFCIDYVIECALNLQQIE